MSNVPRVLISTFDASKVEIKTLGTLLIKILKPMNYQSYRVLNIHFYTVMVVM